jgi:hypothetical protein
MLRRTADRAGRVLWYPTQAKVRLEWGTQPSLPVKQAGPNSPTRVDRSHCAREREAQSGVMSLRPSVLTGDEGWVPHSSRTLA